MEGETMTETDADRRERLEAIRRAMDAGYRHNWWTREVRLLLSEIDRLREIEDAARDYFDAKEALDKRENMWPDGSPTASAYNKYARSRNRLKAKLEGEDG